MSNLSMHEEWVRVDIWKESGKWYDTVAIEWDTYSKDSKENLHEILRRCLLKSVGDRYRGMRATCLEPYHELSHPISIII